MGKEIIKSKKGNPVYQIYHVKWKLIPPQLRIVQKGIVNFEVNENGMPPANCVCSSVWLQVVTGWRPKMIELESRRLVNDAMWLRWKRCSYRVATWWRANNVLRLSTTVFYAKWRYLVQCARTWIEAEDLRLFVDQLPMAMTVDW